MTKAERACYIAARLEELYPRPEAPLLHSDPYTLLVSVLLSAQCTDVRVNQVTPPLFALASTPEAMARQKPEDIQALIRPCGLSRQKAEAIVGLSRILLEKHGGEVPRRLEELEALPGVGHKTASVVLCQGFGEATFPVDTHIHRLAQRWGLSRGPGVAATERDLKSIFPRKKWPHLHLQIIFYGREHCTARGCDGTRCEICRSCYPQRRRPAKVYKA